MRIAERYTLANSAATFWNTSLRQLVLEHGALFPDFLKRALLYAAPLAEPKDVAWILASYAREARARAEQHPLGSFHSVQVALEEALGIQFGGEKGEHFFRSTLVQTLFYGIFSAWVVWSRHDGAAPGARFDWRLTTQYLKVPVLRKLFHEISEPSQLNAAQLSEVLALAAEALNRVIRAEFFAVFSEHEAVAYFYEPFLEAFDSQLRKDLGVWYTPREIVDYMVERVDHVLRTELDRADGLASPDVFVLDPCCGTGAYLNSVLARIYKTLLQKHGNDPLLAHDLKQAALHRVFGFELLPAPFVIAHLQLAAQMEQHGAPFLDTVGERAQVFLTNALTGWEPPREPKPLPFTELEEERDNAEHVKRNTPILVVLGNPPYNNYAGIAKIDEERDLTTAYRTVQNVAPPQGQGLNDLYVRFFRMAERRIVAQTGQGIVCFISNYSWLDGLSHTGMREQYLSVFDRIWIDNLHGDRKISEYAPDGRTSETVFAMGGQAVGIRIGTAIATLVRKDGAATTATLSYRDFDQARASERRTALLASATEQNYVTLTPNLALGLPFKPRVFQNTYLTWPRLSEIFPTSYPGIQTSRDALLVDIDRDRLEARMRRYLNPAITHEQFATEMPSVMENTARYTAGVVREALLPNDEGAEQTGNSLKRGFRPWKVIRFCYRPFDLRWLYWEPTTKLLDEKREDYVGQTLWHETALVSAQHNRRAYDAPYITRNLATRHLVERGSNVFPSHVIGQSLPGETGLHANLTGIATAFLSGVLGTVEGLGHHALAIMHAPAYREENAGALLGDWPRIPLPPDIAALDASAALGTQLVTLLDPESSVTFDREWDEIARRQLPAPLDITRHLEITAGWGSRGQGGTVMPGSGRTVLRPWSPQEEQSLAQLAATHQLTLDATLALFGAQTVDVYLNGNAWWSGVPLNVWEYTLGGYQVIKKWLSYRESRILGRSITAEEVRYVSEVVRRIANILLLAPKLDASYRACASSHSGSPPAVN
jgi:hypothetical protein